jgi:hypothetical protein
MRSHNLQGRLLVDFNNGSFALWCLYPRFKVSMDGRYEETYLPETDQLNAEAFTFGSPEGRRALEILQPTHILVRDTPTDSSSPAEALGDPWRVLYSDTTFTVLGRSDIPAAEERAANETDDIWQPLF